MHRVVCERLHLFDACADPAARCYPYITRLAASVLRVGAVLDSRRRTFVASKQRGLLLAAPPASLMMQERKPQARAQVVSETLRILFVRDMSATLRLYICKKRSSATHMNTYRNGVT